MVKKIKFSKLAIVIFLTVLIWVWADRALEEEFPIQTATIEIGRTKSDLWVSFSKGPIIDINEIILSGPASIINELNQTINNEPEKLKFILYPERLKIDKAGEYKRNVQEIIEQSRWIKDSGLSVKQCDPSEVLITAVELKRQELEVQCYDKDDFPINLETSKKIFIYAPSDWRSPACIDLSYEEINRARQQPISKKPYIVLPNGEIREADSFVEVKLPPQEDILERFRIENAKYGLTLSENLQKAHYNIAVENESLREILNIEIRATQKAKEAYENQDYHVELQIMDGDVEETREKGIVRRKVHYLLPEEFVRTNQIKLFGEKAEAKFKVTPIETNDNP